MTKIQLTQAAMREERKECILTGDQAINEVRQ